MATLALFPSCPIVSPLLSLLQKSVAEVCILETKKDPLEDPLTGGGNKRAVR
jgi:hypothetical protein